MTSNFQIGDHKIGRGCKTFIIGEVAQAHDGSLGIAHSYIEAVADAGADAIKFQTHIADAESTLEEKFRTPFSYEDASRYEYWKRMEFTSEQWSELAEHAEAKGIIFLSSPFSIEAAELLEKIDVPAWKIGSGDVLNSELLSFIARTKKPVLLSSGMSTWREMSSTVDFFKDNGCPVTVLQCTSGYPVKFSEIGLNVISEIENKFGVPAGLSDHSGSVFPSLAAIALGASIIEVHVVFHKKIFGPDTIASITLEELAFLVQASEAFLDMSKPVDKDRMAENMQEMRVLFGRSLAPKVPLAPGTILSRDLITFKKPGTGIPPQDIDKVLGKRLKRALPHNRLLSWEDLEDIIE